MNEEDRLALMYKFATINEVRATYGLPPIEPIESPEERAALKKRIEEYLEREKEIDKKLRNMKHAQGLPKEVEAIVTPPSEFLEPVTRNIRVRKSKCN